MSLESLLKGFELSLHDLLILMACLDYLDKGECSVTIPRLYSILVERKCVAFGAIQR
jgi:hypothetical protein